MVTNRRILVIFPGALGDLICALPAIEALATRHRDCQVELMAKSELAEFVVDRTLFRTGHSIERREVAQLFDGSEQAIAEATRFFGGFERVYSFFGSGDQCFRRALRAAASGAVDFYPFRPNGNGHIREAYLASVVERVGQDAAYRGSQGIRVSESDLHSAKQMLLRRHLSPGIFALIAPGSGSTKKNWPIRNFLELARTLAIAKGFLLGPAEAELGPLLRGSKAEVFQDLPLRSVGALLKCCAWYVGNDSGISHLAGAVGARGIVLFGPTDPSRWRPWGSLETIRADPIDRLPVSEVKDLLHALIGAQP